jgi:hypothetical protein
MLDIANYKTFSILNLFSSNQNLSLIALIDSKNKSSSSLKIFKQNLFDKLKENSYRLKNKLFLLTKKQANQKLSQLTVGEYKSRITTNEGQRQALSNKEIDKERLNSFLQTAQNQKGERIKTASVQGQDLKKAMNVQQEKMQAQQTTNILAQAPTEPQVNLTKPNDSNPLLDKVRAG